MPYLSKEKVRKLINDISKLLKSSGLLYLSKLEDDYMKSGFELVNVQRKDYPEPDGTFLTDLINISKKI